MPLRFQAEFPEFYARLMQRDGADIEQVLPTASDAEIIEIEARVGVPLEDNPGVQGTFYQDTPDTGTLRVSVLQWQGSSEEDRNDIAKNILLPGEVETLTQGVYLKREVKDGSEEGVALRLHRWLVVLALPENICRLVVYTHTVTPEQENKPSIIAELQTVDFAVRNAAYSYEPQLPLLDKP